MGHLSTVDLVGSFKYVLKCGSRKIAHNNVRAMVIRRQSTPYHFLFNSGKGDCTRVPASPWGVRRESFKNFSSAVSR